MHDKTWLYEQHVTKQRSRQDIADELGIDNTTVSRLLTQHEINGYYYFKFDEQKELESFVQGLGFIIKSNDKKLIHPNELDIVIDDKKLAIEYCGLYWHSELNKDVNYHKNKLIKTNDQNYRLLTIFQNEWLHKPDIIKRKLQHLLDVSQDEKIYARKTTVVITTLKEKQLFFDQYHIQGNGPSSINYGLEHNNEIVAVMGFIKNNDGSYTLNRYATSCSVVGGFSKLLVHFERQYNKLKIISFADLRWSEGDLYYKNGFNLDKILEPDYQYIIKDTLVHKFNLCTNVYLKF